MNLEEGADLSDCSERIAELSSISAIEFERKAVQSSDCKLYPYEGPSADTKATSSYSSTYPFNDPSLSDQWHYINYGSGAVATSAVSGADIDVKDVWTTLSCGDPEIIVAVVDEGVKYTHPDLAANMWANSGEIAGNGLDDAGNGYVDDVYGYNFVTNGEVSWSLDGDSGHGTHCAGTIAAVNNNGVGVSGVAGGSGASDGCRIMSCQVFSGNQGGYASMIANAIKYAADNGASVISCSFGYSTSFSSDNAYYKSIGTVESDAIRYFEASNNNPVLDGSIAIFASGNDAQNFAHYPGALYDIISVSAFGPDFLPAYYTNYGPGCNIAAPGGEAYLAPWTSYKAMVLSTVPSELNNGEHYAYMQGTSMACPHVAGVVALALSYAKERGKTFTVSDFKNMILSSTSDIDQKIATGTKNYAVSSVSINLSDYYHNMGTGAVDAWRLMMGIDGINCLTVQTGVKQWVDLTSHFGSSSVSLTYESVEVSDETVEALGLQQISGASSSTSTAVPESGYALVQFGRLYVHPTKIGSGTITIKAVGGGSAVGGGDNPPGGMELTQTISLIARDADGGNGTGGWL